MNKKNFKFKKVNLLNFDLKKMEKWILSIGEKSFCAKQIMIWIYKYYCTDFNEMTNISKSLRKKLKLRAKIKPIKFKKKYKSIDGTIKWISFIGSQAIETVYLPEKKRFTLCISSQVGCGLNCTFCSTGQSGFNRNLKTSEIISQVWNVNKKAFVNKNKKNFKITNIVFMGMGEPLLNFNNVLTSLKILKSEFGLRFSKRKITLSTSGIVPAIKKLIGVIDIKLALSLHASNDFIRNQIMPINKKYCIKECLNAVKKYYFFSTANKNGITIEYIMLKNINDSFLHANELSILLRHIPSKINLIPWNFFNGSKLQASNLKTIQIFSYILKKNGFFVTIRKNRGVDINAACGQLAGKVSISKKFF